MLRSFILAFAAIGVFGSAHAAITTNAITTNALHANAITTNAITTNALHANAITTNAISANGFAQGIARVIAVELPPAR